MATSKTKTKLKPAKVRAANPAASIKEGIRRGEKAWPKAKIGKTKTLSKGRIKKAALLDRVEELLDAGFTNQS